MSASGFVKRIPGAAAGQPQRPRCGTRLSVHNGQVLISSGIASLDDLVGGGFPLGTLVLVKSDRDTGYAGLLLRYFLAEGLASGHSVCAISADSDPQSSIISSLPAEYSQPSESVADTAGTQKDLPAEEKLKIAWRYQTIPKTQDSTKESSLPQYRHAFDLNSRISDAVLSSSQHLIHCITLCSPRETSDYVTCRQRLAELCQRFPSGDERILRIGVEALGSPFWNARAGGKSVDRELAEFFYMLRNVLRKTSAVCCVTLPSHLYESHVVRGVEHVADAVLELESFTENHKNPAFKDYHGLFYIEKPFRLNSLLAYVPDTMNLAFRVTRRRFAIEKLHLPPDLSFQAGSSAPPGASPCASTGAGPLDF